jgi:hypothetical protein
MSPRCFPALLLAGALALLPACTTARTGPSFAEVPAATTGTALIEQLGAPSAVRREGDAKLLRWDAKATKGMTLGLGYYVARLIFSKHRVAQDRVYARVGPDDRVRELRVLRGSDELAYSLWPFTD